MSINESNIINIDDSQLKENTPMIQVTSGEQTLTVPILPDNAFTVNGKDGNIIDIAQSSVLPGTPMIRAVFGGIERYFPVLFNNDLTVPQITSAIMLGKIEDDNSISFSTLCTGAFKKISAGSSFFFVLDDKGCVWGYGNNSSGELGLGVGSADFVDELTQVPITGYCEDIAAGGGGSLIKAGNSLWELDSESRVFVQTDTPATNEDGLDKISAGTRTMAFSLMSGALYVKGLGYENINELGWAEVQHGHGRLKNIQCATVDNSVPPWEDIVFFSPEVGGLYQTNSRPDADSTSELFHLIGFSPVSAHVTHEGIEGMVDGGTYVKEILAIGLSMYAWGTNKRLNLGLGSEIGNFKFQKVSDRVCKEVCLGDRSLAVDDTGRLWITDPDTGYFTQTQIANCTSIGGIVTLNGSDYIVILGEYVEIPENYEVALWVSGSDAAGGLGLGEEKTTASEFTEITGHKFKYVTIDKTQKVTYAIGTNGCLWSWGDGTFIPTLLDNTQNWVKITAYGGDVLAIDSNGYLWYWGESSSTDKPTKINNTKWIDMAIAGSVCVGIDTAGEIWWWYSNAKQPIPTKKESWTTDISIGVYKATSVFGVTGTDDEVILVTLRDVADPSYAARQLYMFYSDYDHNITTGTPYYCGEFGEEEKILCADFIYSTEIIVFFDHRVARKINIAGDWSDIYYLSCISVATFGESVYAIDENGKMCKSKTKTELSFEVVDDRKTWKSIATCDSYVAAVSDGIF